MEICTSLDAFKLPNVTLCLYMWVLSIVIHTPAVRQIVIRVPNVTRSVNRGRTGGDKLSRGWDGSERAYGNFLVSQVSKRGGQS